MTTDNGLVTINTIIFKPPLFPQFKTPVCYPAIPPSNEMPMLLFFLSANN